jgi:hypothetical protein
MGRGLFFWRAGAIGDCNVYRRRERDARVTKETVGT